MYSLGSFHRRWRLDVAGVLVPFLALWSSCSTCRAAGWRR